MITMNMAELYKIAKQVKEEAKECQMTVGGFSKCRPHLPKGPAIGTIINVEDVHEGNKSFMRLYITFCLENQQRQITIKKALFYSKATNSEYVLTLDKLLDDFVVGEPFNKSELIGTVIDVEIVHKIVETGEIAVIDKIYGKHIETIEEFSL